MLYQRSQVSILDYPLGGGLFSHLGNAGEVIGRIAAQGSKVGILRGGKPVFILDGFWGKPVQRGYAFHGIEHRGRIRNQLQVIAITGNDQRLVVLRLGGKGGQNIVGLVIFTRERRNTQGL